MLGSMLVSSIQGMGEVTMGKVPWGSMLGSMLGSNVGFQLSGYGRGHYGKGTVGVHVGFHARSVLYSWQLFFEKSELNV